MFSSVFYLWFSILIENSCVVCFHNYFSTVRLGYFDTGLKSPAVCEICVRFLMRFVLCLWDFWWDLCCVSDCDHVPEYDEEVDGRGGCHQLSGAGHREQVHLRPWPRGFHRPYHGQSTNHCTGVCWVKSFWMLHWLAHHSDVCGSMWWLMWRFVVSAGPACRACLPQCDWAVWCGVPHRGGLS